MATVVTVASYNTLTFNGDQVYRIVTPYAGPYFYNVMNLGPSTVYIRADQDPTVGDSLSVTLPPFACDNLILVPEGTDGLRFVAGPPTASSSSAPPGIPPSPDGRQATITLRLVRG